MAPCQAEPAARDAQAETDPYEVLSQIGHALEVVEHEYYTPPDQDKLTDGALRGMIAELDPHSAYFNRADLALFDGSVSGKFGGIGVEVEFVDGQIIVIAPIEGSPADRAGILPGDQIVAISDRPLIDMPPNDVVGLMRGPIGSKLRLIVRHEKTKQLEDIEIIREQIAVTSVTSRLLNGSVGYFRIKAFQDGTHREFLSALGSMRTESGELSGLILDLRNNPGGLVRQAAALADEFLSSGVLFSTRHRNQIVRVDEARAGGAYTSGPLVVLINEYSASAAELVAGALKDHGRAVVVGARTFGKGSVQTLLHLTNGGALKLTTALYYTPSGKTTQAHGVSPHRFVNPGYETRLSLGALREEDLKGHLRDSKQGTLHDASSVAPRGLPPTNDDLHLGVARVIPHDPSDSPDLALAVAYQTILGRSNNAAKSNAPVQ